MVRHIGDDDDGEKIKERFDGRQGPKERRWEVVGEFVQGENRTLETRDSRREQDELNEKV